MTTNTTIPHVTLNFPSPVGNDLIEAYKGYYAEHEDPNSTEQDVIKHIQSHTPKERLEVYLEWNGIIGYTGRIFEIATGEV